MSTKDCSNSATPQKKRSLRFALGVAALSVLLNTLVKASPNIFTGDFEEGDFSKWKKELCCKHSAEIVSSPTRAGEHAVKFTLKKDDPIVASSKRAELRLGTVPANSEQWFGFSVFFPSNYQKDPSAEIVYQWHEKPDKHLGETWRTPPLYLKTQKGNLYLQRRWDSNQVTKNNEPEGKETIELGPYKTGVWTDFVFHIKWSHKSDGLLEVWKDDKRVVRKTGPNTYNDERGPYFKIGIYKFDWKKNSFKSNTTQRVIYFDEVRVGDANSSYKDVDPQTVAPRAASQPDRATASFSASTSNSL